MKLETVQDRVARALRSLLKSDSYLLEKNLSERCLTSRFAMHLQREFPKHVVDVEYNRDGLSPKRFRLPDACANYCEGEEPLVVPDVIVHRRGRAGPNLLAIEVKKSTNREPRACDQARLAAFRNQLGYIYGALVELETRAHHSPRARVAEWQS
jgi:hypothetical protein